MEQMRHALDKDPYEVMFGWSNRLREPLWSRTSQGRSPPFPWSMLDEQKFGSAFLDLHKFPGDKFEKASQLEDHPSRPKQSTPESSESQRSNTDGNKAGHGGPHGTRIPVHKSYETPPKSSADTRPHSPGTFESVSQAPSRPHITGSLAWSRSMTASSGRRTDESGIMEYDPISMRMVPKERRINGEPASTEPDESRQRMPKMENVRPRVLQASTYSESAMKAEMNSAESDFAQNVRAREQAYLQAKHKMSESNDQKSQVDQTKVAKSRTAAPVLEEHVSEPEISNESEDLSQRAQSLKQAYAKFRDNQSTSKHQAPPTHHSPRATIAKSLDSGVGGPDTPEFDRFLRESRRLQAATTRNHNLAKSKEDMEQSWLKQKKSHGQVHGEAEGISAISREKLAAAEAWKRFKGGPVRHQPPRDEDEVQRERLSAKLAAGHPIFDKSKPLKQMNPREFYDHKARLCDRWSRKHPVPRPASPADKKLEEEVKAQKQAMQAYENKWSQQMLSSDRSGPAVSSTSRTDKPELIAGEGDMSANVAEFADKGKWYKQVAPSADEQRTRDRELVRKVQQIYEDAYGSIDAKHRQGNLRKDAYKTSQVSVMFDELNDADDARFARFLNTNKIAPTLPKKTDTSSAEKPVFGPPVMLKVPEEQSKLSDAKIQNTGTTFQASGPINPVDGTTTTQRSLNITQAASSVNHEHSSPGEPVPKPEKPTKQAAGPSISSTPPDRLVRKEEDVFSGSLPTQRYTIPEIVALLKEQGLTAPQERRPNPSSSTTNTPPVPPPNNNNNSNSNNNAGDAQASPRRRHTNGNNHGNSYKTGFERGQRHQRRRLWRRFVKVLAVGAWTAGCCYAVGVVTEFFRRDRPWGGLAAYDEDAVPEGWENVAWSPQGREQQQQQQQQRRLRRRERGNGNGGFWAKSGQQGRGEGTGAAEAREQKSGGGVLSEMPLRGFELPLTGLLVGCVWFLVSGGGGS